ncbi:hypothetical protein DPMN_117944 [Dreissena polymorpha]|uniref:Uncharacterized protein n=1 Tax=Dreissena polymorpha TaxID=45954 RepID=A0A9D4GGM4_DREPO|nr:hypothetical protein DPMN_117944 [Dreissena polymorpha]
MYGRGHTGFQGRNTLPALSANVGKIKGNNNSVVKVEKNVDLYWGTRVGIVNTLSIGTNVHVAHGGKIDLPKTVIIDKGWWLDICGTISTSTDLLTVREKGELRMSYPASDLNVHTVVVDYEGKMAASTYCPSTQKVYMSVTYFNTTADFTLDTNLFSLSSGQKGTVSKVETALNYTACPLNGTLDLKRGQFCEVITGASYSFTTLTIEPGAEIRVKGSATGVNLTTITAANVDIKFGGLITGVGKGFMSNRPWGPNCNRKRGYSCWFWYWKYQISLWQYHHPKHIRQQWLWRHGNKRLWWCSN